MIFHRKIKIVNGDDLHVHKNSFVRDTFNSSMLHSNL